MLLPRLEGVNRPTFADDLTVHSVSERLDQADILRSRARYDSELISVEPIGQPDVGLAQPSGAPDNRVQNRSHGGGRAGNDAQHLGGRRLLLQRLAQAGV